MLALSTLTIWVGTLGAAICGLVIALGLVRFAQAVLPDDPPPLVDGESIHSRLVKLPPEIRDRQIHEQMWRAR
jgi:hypothetical protein